MSKYKQLNAVAKNFCASFTSMMNWEEKIYIMDVLIFKMSLDNVEQFDLNILTGEFTSKFSNSQRLNDSVNYYTKTFFPHLLKAHKLTMDYVHSASFNLKFDFDNVEENNKSVGSLLVPYTATTCIVDKKLREHKQLSVSRLL